MCFSFIIQYIVLILLINQFNDTYGKCAITFVTGSPYCYIQFENKACIPEIIKDYLQIEKGYHKFMKFESSEKNDRFIFIFFTERQVQELQSFKANIDQMPMAYSKLQIPGLEVYHDFISLDEEKILFDNINAQKWGRLSKRRVQHYGYEFIYGANTINKNNKINPIPDYMNNIVDQITQKYKDQQQGFDQLTINDYFPGDGIASHFDVHNVFHEVICLVSLMSGIVMTFKSYRGEEKNLYIPPRSLVTLQGEIRFAWFHQIHERTMDRVDGEVKFRDRRISLTFRKIRFNQCKCQYPFFCEDQGYDPVTMKSFNPMLEKILIVEEQKQDKNQLPKTSTGKKVNNKTEYEKKIIESANATNKPTELEKKYVYEVYEKIAPHFAHTRYKPWPKIANFLNQLPEYSLVADIGCGNGKYLCINPKLHM